MSVKPIQREAIICDGCEKELSEHPKPLLHKLIDGIAVVEVTFEQGEDICEPCQREAIAQAARELGTRKPRGRAAQRREVVTDEQGTPLTANSDQTNEAVSMPDFHGDTQAMTHSAPEPCSECGGEKIIMVGNNDDSGEAHEEDCPKCSPHPNQAPLPKAQPEVLPF